MTLAADLTAFQNAVTAYNAHLYKKFDKSIANEYVDIAAGATLVYDLQTLLGADDALYDKKRTKALVQIKDPNNTSSTYNMYINSESVITVAIDAERYVRITNQYSASLNAHIAIDVPYKV